jgi:Ca-activated chloride channel family protein
MSIRSIMLSLAGAAAFSLVAAAQNSQPDLPSAPSASKQESQKAKAPPPAKPQPEAAPPGEQADPQASPQSKSPSTALPAPEPDEPATTIRTTVNEVNVIFTVTDRKGRYITDLKRDDFRVIDDGRPAAEIRSFHRETNLPLQVGLLVDASNSVRDRFRFEQESAIEFLNQTIRPRYDKAFTVGFDATPEVTQDFTDNTEQLSKGVRALRPGGGTAMYDALYFACRDKLAKEQQSGPVRRAIVLLSDGDDNQSHVSREEAIEMAQRADVIVYTISTNVAGSRNAGDKILGRMADATGGRAFYPFQITDVANAFSEIQDELRSQYALSYKPAEFRADGRYRAIEILVQNHKGLKVRTRHGYFAPAQ